MKKFSLILLAAIMLVTTMTVYADGNDWAENVKDWVLQGVQYIVLAVIAVFAVKFIAKRQFVQFGGFVVLAMFVLVVVYYPEKLKDLGVTLWNIIFGSR
ncbi:MAG: hypothetical protein ACM3TR_00990 [Caulobacteraceae bacterium]